MLNLATVQVADGDTPDSMASQRGFTLLEALVASFVGSMVLLGFSTFFGWMVGIGQEIPSELAVQRQATLILEEMGRRIRTGKSTTVTRGACKPTDPHSIGVTLPSPPYPAVVTYCFYRSGNGFREDRTSGGTTVSFDLLSPSSLILTNYASCFNDVTSCPGANSVVVNLQLQCTDRTCAPAEGTDWSNALTVTTTFFLRNN